MRSFKFENWIGYILRKRPFPPGSEVTGIIEYLRENGKFWISKPEIGLNGDIIFRISIWILIIKTIVSHDDK